MNVTVRLAWPASWIGLLPALMAGCAGLTASAPPPESITAQRKQRSEEAARCFETERDSAEFQAAFSCWDQGDVEQCRQGLERLLKRNPPHRDARLLMADVFLAENDPQGAYGQLEEAIRAHPEDAQVQYAMGLLLDTTGQETAALACYEQAATWEPDNEVYVVGYRTALAAAEGGQPATTAKRPGNPHPEAIGPAAYAGRAEVSDLPPANTLFDKGRAALAEGSLETARAYFQEAAAISPDNPQIPISAAVTALRYRQPALAIELLAPVRECPSASARVHRILGVAYYRLGDYRSSQVAIQQALSLDKLSALSYFLMGCTLAKLGQFESAEAHWQQARTIDPRYAVHR